jgi:hypothetical protein
MAQYADLARLRQLLAQGYSQRAIAKELGISRTALQRFLHALKTPASAPLTPALLQIFECLQRLETAVHPGETTGEDRQPGLRVMSDMSVRWSVRVPRSMAQHVRTLATVRKQPPSRLVQEALRHWLAGQ